MQRVGGDSATFEGQKVQHFQGTSRLVATRRFLLSQGHAGIHRKDIDHLQRRGGPAALVGAAQGLAVDCHHACEVETIGLGKGGHEAAECEGSKVSGLSRRNTRLNVRGSGCHAPGEGRAATALPSTAQSPPYPSTIPLRTALPPTR